jgi:hypothetical protein
MAEQKRFACSDCGHEQDSMTRPCDECGSVRVVTIAVLESLAGPNWRDNFNLLEGPPDSSVSPGPDAAYGRGRST